MIRLNVSLLLEKEENRQALRATAVELVELSLHDTGCIDYDLYKSQTNDDRYMIYETWNSRDELQAHMNSDHFKRLVPELQKLATMTLEEFEF